MTHGGRIAKGALVFFGLGAVLGVVFALVGPVTMIRVLGMVAFACAAAGCALHLAVLRRTDPRAFHALGRLWGRAPRYRAGVLHSAVLTPRPTARA